MNSEEIGLPYGAVGGRRGRGGGPVPLAAAESVRGSGEQKVLRSFKAKILFCFSVVL